MDIFFFVELLIIVIAIVTIILAIRKMKFLGFHWLTWFVVFVDALWLIYYTYQIYTDIANTTSVLSRTHIRLGTLLTLVLLLVKEIRVNRRIK